MFSTKRLLLGRPLQSNRLVHEKLPKWKALPAFSSDALSSVAYATEEILIALTSTAILTPFLLTSAFEISIAILALLLFITLSYSKIIKAFPGGGGAYVIAREHLGTKVSLVAAASLMLDYILTVSVSISSGVAALSSAFPILAQHKVLIAIFFVLILVLLNLRGITEAATLLAVPTYLFIGLVLLMVILGFVKLITHGWGGFPVPSETNSSNNMLNFAAIFILLRAFSGGCSAMTGVEAISNGVPSFREKSAKNAVITLFTMSSLLSVMFIGISTLAIGYGVLPGENATVISQVASNVFGSGVLYYIFQITTMSILFIAANTSFAGFPQLTSIVAHDGFLPRNLSARGDKLVFSNGIILLGVASIFLIFLFGGETHSLIPLYAVGVFLSFTIGQIGLFKKTLTDDKPIKSKFVTIITSALGAVITGVVSVVTLIAKFSHGAWIVTILIPITIIIFLKIKAHYTSINRQLKLSQRSSAVEKTHSKVIIPISGVSRVVDNSIRYAKLISDDITVFSVVFEKDQENEIRRKWDKWYPDTPLKIHISEFRTMLRPLLALIDKTEKDNPNATITVIVPQFIVKKWWHTLLHNQSATILKVLLIMKKDIVICTIPFHLGE